MKTNIDQRFLDIFKTGLNLTLTRIANDNTQLGKEQYENSGIIRSAIQMGPHIKAYDPETGKYPVNPLLGTQPNLVVDRATLDNQGRLLGQVRELLVLANGYGLDSVHERALVTAETVSQSLAAVTDDSQLETVVDLRVAFCRPLLALSADERAEKEALDTTELCLSQG